MIADPAYFAVNQFDDALEDQGHEAVASKKLVYFFTGDGVEASGHDGSPVEKTHGNNAPTGVHLCFTRFSVSKP
jgi:hypothetical protein